MRHPTVLIPTLFAALMTGSAPAQVVLSNHVTITDTTPPVLGFIDITSTGITIPNVEDDSVHVVTPTFGNFTNVLFDFGNGVQTAISNNGVVVTGVGPNPVPASFNNEPIPATGLPAGLAPGGTGYLLPFWDDLVPPVPFSNMTLFVAFPVPGVWVVMWREEAHFGVPNAFETITFEVQIFDSALFPDCSFPAVQFLYQDTTFDPSAVNENQGASATIGYAGPLGNAQWSFDTASVFNGTCLSLHAYSATLSASAIGPGALQLAHTTSCTADSRLLAVTFHQGTFPNGWLFGLDIPVNELANELAIGPPFTGPGGPFTLGPFFGLPPVTLYAVVVAYEGGVGLRASSPLTFTIP